MLLFRSEEHVERWCRQWNLSRGAVLTPQTCWRLARGWFHDRLTLDFRRRIPQEAQGLFTELGLTSDFWRLT